MPPPLPPTPTGVLSYPSTSSTKVSEYEDMITMMVIKHLASRGVIVITFFRQVSVEFFLDLDCPFSRKMFKTLYETVIPTYEGKVRQPMQLLNGVCLNAIVGWPS